MSTAEPDPPITAIFVYGTLKQGGCRARCWPRPPIAVESVTIRGELYDLGPYPGLAPGEQTIRGELWHVSAEDMPETLRVLDEVEGATELGSAYYRRIIVNCRTDRGKTQPAYAYEFADPTRLLPQQIILPNAAGECMWPAER